MQPLDIHTELTRSVTVQRIQELVDRASLAAQHRHAKDVQEEQLEAETRVLQAPESEEQAGIGDRQTNDSERRDDADLSKGETEPSHDNSGAGDIEIIPDAADQHRLDIRA